MIGEILVSLSTWEYAENFYNVYLPMLFLIISVSFLFVLFFFFYASIKKSKYLVTIFIVGVFITAIYTIEKHHQYSSYLEEYSLLNPLTRDRNMLLGFPSFYSHSEQAIYYDYNDIKSLRKLSMYEENIIEINLKYLGENHYFHYFEYEDEIFKTSKKITFSDSVDNAMLIGSQFILIDPDYTKIGFNNNLNVMFDTIIVNKKDSNEFYDPTKNNHILLEEFLFSNWNF